MKNKKMDSKKKLVLHQMHKKVGTRVQSPDQQYKTGQMGKQPIAVYR